MRKLISLFLLIVCLVPAGPAQAGTTKIRVEIEAGGDIFLGGPHAAPADNTHGSIFWNGSDWTSNDTSAHMYFVSTETGERLRPHTEVALAWPGADQPLLQTDRATIAARAYTYTDLTLGCAYTAVEYVIEILAPAELAGARLRVRSRGSGNGQAQSYFDIYVEQVDGTTLAIQNGADWNSYALSLEQALLAPAAVFRGQLPTAAPTERAQYWLDANGGADMGGVTYHFETAALTPQGAPAAPAYPVAFSLKLMDGASNLIDYRLEPEILAQAADPQISRVYLPMTARP